MLGTILIVLFVLLLLGALPQSPLARSRDWGYYPSGTLTLILVIVLVLVVAGHI